MRTGIITTLATLALLTACEDTSFAPYYADRSDPEVPLASGETLGSEIGTAGGNELVIRGAGFGHDPERIMVLIGNHNAEVLEATDTELRVRTPIGPLTGGRVNVVIGTPNGYTELPEAYHYDVGVSASDAYTKQENYILVQNFWNSCYGGKGIGQGCEQVAYVGETGFDGQAEFFEFYYPRVHSAYAGFVTGADFTGEWELYKGFEQPFPSGVEDLRRPVGDFKLINEEHLGETACIALGDGRVEDCNGSDVKNYDLGEMQFCEGYDPVSGPTGQYRADWPVVHNFFEGPDGTFAPVDIKIAGAEDEGLDGIGLTLPPPIAVRAEVGFDDPDFWAATSMAACGDSNGDGEARLDDDGIVLSWEPIDAELGGDNVTAINSYLHVSISYMNIGWFSGDGFGLRGSVVIPDDNQVDPETGRASVGIPNWLLYQFPTPNATWTGTNTMTETGYLGSFDSKAGYTILEIMRVTDYRIETDQGVTVFSYVTGDMSFPDWTNPMESGDSCSDCLDGDDDGWTDDLDPDCVDGDSEDGTYDADYTCSDGIDNNGDGLVDKDDPLCASGLDAETDCADGIDNDGDGWSDDLDPNCSEGEFPSEDGPIDPSWLCSDGLDNDGDGWIDAEDPGCADGADADEGGLSDTACNDGLDNDGDGLVDADDPYCALNGGGSLDSESPELRSQCANGVDDDGDGFVDALDPHCEFAPNTREGGDFMDPEDTTAPWYGVFTVPQCYDGLDNDGDGATDAADPSCWNPLEGFLADGFMADEGAEIVYPPGHPNEGEVTDCTDGIDGDGDGWIDAADPDCVAGDPNAKEVGLGTTQCNDGVDNESPGDGLIDAADPQCTSGWDNTERI